MQISQAERDLAKWSAALADDPHEWVLRAFPWGEPGTELEHRHLEQWQADTLKQIGDEIKLRGFSGEYSVPALQMAIGSGHGTGKSALCAMLIMFIMSTRPYAKGVVTANTQTQLESKTWAELSRWKRMCATGHWFNLTASKGAMRMAHKVAPELWRVDAIPNRKEASEAFAGLHAANSTPFFIFDEASGIHDIIWEVAEGGTTDGEPMWFAFGNRTRPTGRYHECWSRFAHRWITRTVDSREVSLTSKERIQQWIDDYGEDSDFVRVRVRGLPPLAATTQLIGLDVIEAAETRYIEAMPTEGLVAGVDTAWYGDDRSVVAFRRGPDARSIEPRVMRKRDPMQVARECMDIHAELDVRLWVVEITGFGSGVYARLNEAGIPVMAWDPAERWGRLEGDQIAWNVRARDYLRLARWLQFEGGIRKDSELSSELAAQAYGYKGKEVLLEDKTSIKQTLGRSPDESDALAMTMAVRLPATPRKTLEEAREAYRRERSRDDRRADALLGIRDPFDD